MVISMLSCLNANQLFCSRTLYAMSADGLFFRQAAKVNKGGTPTIALLLSTLAGVIFVIWPFESMAITRSNGQITKITPARVLSFMASVGVIYISMHYGLQCAPLSTVI